MIKLCVAFFFLMNVFLLHFFAIFSLLCHTVSWFFSLVLKGSNDSNYSGPSSGGDLSYEESDRNLINKPAGLNNARIPSDTQTNRHRSAQVKSQQQQQPQQRNQDAKQEVELCRVCLNFLIKN